MTSLTVRQTLSILAISGLCFFTRLGSPKLWDRDEPRNARCAWEMWERDDWVVPTFNGELRAHKPILLYWLMMTAYATFGVSEFAARFWSASLAMGTVALTYMMGRRLFDSVTATWAALCLTTTLMFNVAAHAATPDSALIFCTTLAMTCFVMTQTWSCSPLRLNVPPDMVSGRWKHWRNTAWWAAAAGAMGLGILAKGPVGFVLPVAVWCVFFWLTRLTVPPQGSGDGVFDNRHRFASAVLRALAPRLQPRYLMGCGFAWHPFMVTALALAVAVPWYFAVGQRTDGTWLREFFLEHNVSRAMQPMEGHRGNPLLFYPAAILVGFFPWSSLTIPVVIWIVGRRQDSRYDARFAFCLAWVGVYITAFSLAGTKLPSYVTPTYPALALMVGHFVAQWPESSVGPARWWSQWSAVTLVVVGLLLVIALPWAAHVYLPGEERLGAIGLILLLGGLLCWTQFRGKQLEAGLQRMALTAVCFVVALFGWVAPRVSSHQQIQQLLATARAIDATAPLATLDVHEPSWVFYAGQSILPAGTPQQAKNHVERRQGFLITTRRRYEQLHGQLASKTTVLDTIPYFMKHDDLLLIASNATVAGRSEKISHR